MRDQADDIVSSQPVRPHSRRQQGRDPVRLDGPVLDRLTIGKYDSVHPSFPLSDLRVDLAAHQASFGGIESPVRGVETLYVGAERVRALGSARGEHIRANGCDVVVRGRAGWDLLERGDDAVSICPGLSSVIAGGLGNDLLLGSNRTDDVLLGGPGHDHARGMRGTDTCRAEVRRAASDDPSGSGRPGVPGIGGEAELGVHTGAERHVVRGPTGQLAEADRGRRSSSSSSSTSASWTGHGSCSLATYSVRPHHRGRADPSGR